MTEVASRMHEALNFCLELSSRSRPLIVSHGMALSVLIGTVLGLPAHAKSHLCLMFRQFFNLTCRTLTVLLISSC